MVADQLAVDLVNSYVQPGNAVLDPFCGSGRLLVSAARFPGSRFGIDSNPLACLLTQAKLANPDADVLKDLLKEARRARTISSPKFESFSLPDHRKVEWFAPRVIAELTHIVHWINACRLAGPELLLTAAALSASVRDCSFIRKGGWKLHRIASKRREGWQGSAWDCLERRLGYCIAEIGGSRVDDGPFNVEVGDAIKILNDTASRVRRQPIDVVLTSPPYGDSRTTVQYGAASSICLHFVSKIDGLDHLYAAGRDIDRICLGGAVPSDMRLSTADIRPYWFGDPKSVRARKISSFLRDYSSACAGIADVLAPTGTAVLIVGRRSVGGFRLKLDDHTVDCFESLDLKLVVREFRYLNDKRLPRRVNRYGRAGSAAMRARGIVPTMDGETILVFRKQRS